MERTIQKTPKREIDRTLSIGSKKVSIIKGDVFKFPFNQNNENMNQNELMIQHKIQVDGINNILRETVAKLKLSLMLPFVLKNFAKFKNILKKTEHARIIPLIDVFLKSTRNGTVAAHTNPQLLSVIDYFQQNMSVMDFLPNIKDILTENDLAIIKAFETLQYIADQRLNTTALNELSKEKRTHILYYENDFMRKSIKNYEKQLKSQKINLRWKMAARYSIIRKFEEKSEETKRNNHKHIAQEMLLLSKSIRKIHFNSQIKQKELEEELNIVKEMYHRLLQENISEEKKARAEKNKQLLQLEAILKKYDLTICDTIHENMALEEEFEKQKNLYDEFIVTFEEKETEYYKIVRKQEEEKERQYQQAILLFIMNRAARIIQRAYRAYQVRKKIFIKGLKVKKRKIKSRSLGKKNETNSKGKDEGKNKNNPKLPNGDKSSNVHGEIIKLGSQTDTNRKDISLKDNGINMNADMNDDRIHKNKNMNEK